MTACATPVTQSALVTETASNSQPAQTLHSNMEVVNSDMETSASTSQSRADNYLKLKPQHFSGTDDFEDFLTQFEITSELNSWNYRAKSLHLANCLTGAARSLLNALTADKRRDYKNLVQKLTERYGLENRAEVFRSQLKSRTRRKGETIPELAQAIKKLTRQSYPKVSQDVIEALALDHFIDALTETEIRLRLREVGPKTLTEAEKITVRMEAHRIADKQRTRLVGRVEQDNQNTDTSKESSFLEQQMEKFSKSIESIQKSIQNFVLNQNPEVSIIIKIIRTITTIEMLVVEILIRDNISTGEVTQIYTITVRMHNSEDISYKHRETAISRIRGPDRD